MMVNKGPDELSFVLEVPAEGVVVERLGEFDLYRLAGASSPLPAVVFVHGGLHLGPLPADPGQHGFDVLDHVPRSREAVTEAMDAVHGHLLGGGHS